MSRLTSPLLVLVAVAVAGCEQEQTFIDLAGEDGVLRFNLQFTNETQVDLDLHVITPDGSEIYYGNTAAAGGQLDVDCLCGVCDQGPNENIFWDYQGEAPPGTYTVSVDYYGSCTSDATPTSDFTLRVLQSGTVVNEYLGTLGYLEVATYTHVEAAPGE